MKRNRFFYFYCLFLPLLTFLAACNPEDERYVVVLSVDGFRSDYPEKAHTPTLDSLEKAGVRSVFRPSYPSNTFPNHYSMATGLHPDHHGLINNSFYVEDMDSIYSIGNRAAVTNPDYYGGEPIWNTAENQGIKTASFYWVGSETAIQGMQPSIWKPFDNSVPFKTRADSVISWLELPEEIRPHLIMWYIEEPDAIAHYAGTDSSATINKVEELDNVLHHFFNKARKLDIFDKIDFIVLSDHGMANYYPENYVNLNDYLPRDSFYFAFDGVPTILYPKEGYAGKAMEILKTVPRVTSYRKGDIPEKYIYGKNPRIGEIVVMPDIGTYVQFRAQSRAFAGAAHGYDNFAPEMQAIFYAAGPSFRENVKTPPMPNVNLYLLIAHLLDIKPSPNDGDSATVLRLLKSAQQD